MAFGKEETIRTWKRSTAYFIIQMIGDFFLMCILVGFYFFIRDIIDKAKTELTLTNQRMKGHTGWLHTVDLDCPLKQINGVEVKQGIFAKMFNWGEIIITTPSNVFHFYQIHNPHDIKKLVNNAIEQYEDERMTAQANKIANSMNTHTDKIIDAMNK